MPKKLLLSLAGWLILSFSLTACTAQPLAKIKARSYHIENVELSNVSCNNFEEACFWFRQNWEERTGQKVKSHTKNPAEQNRQAILFNQPVENSKTTDKKAQKTTKQSHNHDDWSLDTALSYSAGPIIFQNKDKEIRYQYNVSGSFKLIHLLDPKLNRQFNINVTSYYDTLDSPVVRDLQKNNALRSSIEELTDKLADRLALIGIAKHTHNQTKGEFEINDSLINTDPDLFEY